MFSTGLTNSSCVQSDSLSIHCVPAAKPALGPRIADCTVITMIGGNEVLKHRHQIPEELYLPEATLKNPDIYICHSSIPLRHHEPALSPSRGPHIRTGCSRTSKHLMANPPDRPFHQRIAVSIPMKHKHTAHPATRADANVCASQSRIKRPTLWVLL